MSKKKPTRKKVIVSTSNTTPSPKKKLTPTTSKATTRRKAVTSESAEMIFGKQNFYLLLVGIALVALGMFLMSGGAQAPNEWNADEIYSFRRTALAPMVILAGLIVNIFAIFRKEEKAV